MANIFIVRCMNCGAEYGSNNEICPHCGFNGKSEEILELEKKIERLSEEMADIDKRLDQLLALLPSSSRYDSKIMKFEYYEWVDNYQGFISGKSADNYIRFAQNEDQCITVFANLIWKSSFVEYACTGDLDTIIHPAIFVSEVRDKGDYDTAGTEINYWKTHIFDREWLSAHCDSECFDEVSEWGSCFRIRISFADGPDFEAEGYAYPNEDLDDLVSGLSTNTEMLRLLAAWELDYEDVGRLWAAVSEEDWYKAYKNPLELTACWIDGEAIPPEKRAIYRRNDNETTLIKEINFADFVVKTYAFHCNAMHDVETIQAVVSVLSEDGTISRISTMAGYCKICNCYFLLERDFEILKSKGKLLCQLLTQKEYDSKGHDILAGKDMKESSVLRRCGYTVNATDDLSMAQRHKILELVLNNGIYTPTRLGSFLDWLISFHGKNRKRNMEKAIERWKEDRRFVQQYEESKRGIVEVKKITC